MPLSILSVMFMFYCLKLFIFGSNKVYSHKRGVIV